MSRRGGNNHKAGFYRPSAGRTETGANENDNREQEIIGLRLQIVMLKTKHGEVSRDYEELQDASEQAGHLILRKIRIISELSKQFAIWEKRAEELQQANDNLQDLMQTTEQSQWSAEVQRQAELQVLTVKQTRLQTALQDSEGKCVALEEEVSRKLAESEERHHLELTKRAEDYRRDQSQRLEMFQKELSERDCDLQKHLSERDAGLLEVQRLMDLNTQLQTSLDETRRKCGALEELSQKLSEDQQRHLLDLAKRDEDCRRDLSLQAERLQEEISERDNVLLKHLSERDECLLELQRLREENTQLKEFLKKKKKKRSFWRRVFGLKKKTPDRSEPSSV